MATYLVKVPHDPEEHIIALDGYFTGQFDTMNEFSFACVEGEHTGYAVITASNKEKARMTVPEPLREGATIVELRQLTPDLMPA